jgi:hypothetical protein
VPEPSHKNKGSKNKGTKNKAGARKRRRRILRQANAQELAFRTVTARRFCDQHEMSLQTATGRSLP